MPNHSSWQKLEDAPSDFIKRMGELYADRMRPGDWCHITFTAPNESGEYVKGGNIIIIYLQQNGTQGNQIWYRNLGKGPI